MHIAAYLYRWNRKNQIITIHHSEWIESKWNEIIKMPTHKMMISNRNSQSSNTIDCSAHWALCFWFGMCVCVTTFNLFFNPIQMMMRRWKLRNLFIISFISLFQFRFSFRKPLHYVIECFRFVRNSIISCIYVLSKIGNRQVNKCVLFVVHLRRIHIKNQVGKRVHLSLKSLE